MIDFYVGSGFDLFVWSGDVYLVNGCGIFEFDEDLWIVG